MTFNWIAGREIDERLHRLCIELEYEFRPKIIKFLIANFDMEGCSDFSCFHFDVNLVSKRVTLSDDTPLIYLQQIKPDFDQKLKLAFANN
ncbi:hypothetical protein D9O36_03040 [Zobellia amurskyensis]|uniref:Uncharacterized protein n=1 Tax=Zobellia amurskyensis TaxID=248905 RepID=A0A7X2ZR13_9FLAO|nr:hypothetical protein [Zobellia amurskyensis]MUH34807.1 hypothetical protein [Zobellia amurskyensis]